MIIIIFGNFFYRKVGEVLLRGGEGIIFSSKGGVHAFLNILFELYGREGR